MRLEEERTTIDRFDTGFIITIKDRNWTKIGHYVTPCFVKYYEDVYTLTNTAIINRSTGQSLIGRDFEYILPDLLRNGTMLLEL